MKRIIALFLTWMMVFTLVACDTTETKPVTVEPSQPVEEVVLPESTMEDILAVGCAKFGGKFSPFFATEADDMDVADIVSQRLFVTDREGAVLLRGMEGQKATAYGTEYTYHSIANCAVVANEDGTVEYQIVLRDDICFSDGTKMTADDVIFTLYALCDPSYDGPSALHTLPIIGLEAYRSGMRSMMDLMVEKGKSNTDFTNWTEEEQTAFWADLEQAGTAFAEEIVAYCAEQGAEDVVSAAEMWGYTLEEDATASDFFTAMCEAYAWNLTGLSATETIETSLFDYMESYSLWSKNIPTGETADYIEGIQKTGDYALSIKTASADPAAVSLLNIAVAPLHHYGDPKLYDYENHQFGFPKGDLSSLREKNGQPLGAGPYKFVSYADGIVVFEANESYWKGAPKLKHMLWEEIKNPIASVLDGTVDIAKPEFTAKNAKRIKAANENGKLSGDTIETVGVDHTGYGYIGINTYNVRVGDAGSDASKALRKAFATLFAAHRSSAITAYYGNRAEVIEYPASDTFWAAPKKADEGYQIAYSVDKDGNPIYNADMTAEQRRAAAVTAARGFFEAAGYTFDESGKVIAAPIGGELTYEFVIPAEGNGNHPSYAIAAKVKEDLASMGITLEITDLTDETQLWDSLAVCAVDMWAAAWDTTGEADLYQIYYSGNIGESNHYYLQDLTLDAKLQEARSIADPAAREELYLECLNIILDWGVEVPVYQRQNAVIFSSDRLNMDTVTPDITTHWTWMNDIEQLEMK